MMMIDASRRPRSFRADFVLTCVLTGCAPGEGDDPATASGVTAGPTTAGDSTHGDAPHGDSAHTDAGTGMGMDTGIDEGSVESTGVTGTPGPTDTAGTETTAVDETGVDPDSGDDSASGTTDDPGVGDEPCVPMHDAATPALSGPYCVGLQRMHLVDDSREETFTMETGDSRELLVNLWYPILPGSDKPPALWFLEHEWEWLGQVGIIAAPDGYQTRYSNAVEGEAVATGPFPVIVFMPGTGTLTCIYTAVLVERLVSHGFVVAAINHPYLSGPIRFPDGRSVPGRNTANDDPELHIGSADAQFVLDHLEGLNESDPAWMERLDFSKVGSFGQSFGGATSMQLVLDDERVLAGGNYDGTFFGDIRMEGTGTAKPFLMVGSAQSNYGALDGDWGEVWARLTGPAYVAAVTGTTHAGMSDLGLLQENLGQIANTFYLGSIGQSLQADIYNVLAYEFFEAHLLGGDPNNLIAAAEAFAEVTMQSK